MSAPECPADVTVARDYPFSVPLRLDFDPLYAQLRAQEPVSRVRLPYGGEGWLVTRYADVRKVLSDPRFSRAATVGREDVPRMQPEPPSGKSILDMDAPEHTRIRRLVAKEFTGRRVELLRPRASEVMDELLTGMERHGKPADLVENVAIQLPIIIICDLLGVSPADQGRFRHVSDVVLATGGPTRAEIIAASRQLAGYLAELIAQRREQPGDDLLSALVQARDEEDKLSEAELVQLGVNLLFAGYETTANQVANFAYVLLSDREQWNRLLADRTLVNNAVEELLRWIPLAASGGFARIATEDIELSGVVVKQGEAVFAKTHAANRDDSVFGCPEQLDLARTEIPHMTFGHGMHRCLGAQLARMELQVALEALLTRYPNLALAVPDDEIKWKSGVLLRGPEALPVTW